MRRVAAVLSLSFALVVAARGSERDARFLAGLRERQLFETAERWAAERQGTADISVADKTDLVVELIRTYAVHAVNSPPAEREVLWQKSQKTADEFFRKDPKPPRGALVRFQAALANVARGELLRLDYESGGDPAAAAQAQAVLRDAGRRLEDLQKQVAAELQQRRNKPAKDEELSLDELTGLSHQIARQQARALRGLALTFPAEDENRLALLLNASEQLKQALGSLGAADPSAVETRLDAAITSRLAGQADAARAAVEPLDRDDQPSAVRLQARAEELRLAIAAEDPARAASVIQRGRLLEGRPHPELDLAILEFYVARWRTAVAAKKEQAAADERQKAVAMTKFIDQTHGRYWGRRADQLLVAAAPQSGAAAGFEILKRAADNLYLKGQFADAVAAYEQGAAAAKQAGDANGAFELLYKAGLVDQQRKSHAAAAGRLRRATVEAAAHPQAAEAHLLAAWNAAQELRANPAAEETYLAILREQTALWPDSPSADQARIWLGRFNESKQDWEAAIEAYAAVSPASVHFAAATTAIGPCFERRLADAANDSAAKAAALRQAESYYRTAIGMQDGMPPTRWSAPQRVAAAAFAGLLLTHRTDGYVEAERILEAARSGEPAADAAWRRDAEALSVVALAAQPAKREQAGKLLQQWGDASSVELLALLDRLTVVAERSRPEVRQGIAELQLQTVRQLHARKSQLTAEQVAALDRIEAQALATAGKRTEALAAFAKVVGTRPQDGDLQEAYAELLAADGARISLEQALSQWRKVAAKSPPQSPRWYRAKLAVANLQHRLGDSKAAAQLIRYLMETPPGIDAEWQGRFATLLKACES